MNNTNKQRITWEERASTREKREGNKKGKTILDHLIPRSRMGSKESINILNKRVNHILNKRRRNKEEDRIGAERELGKFEKARKITRSPPGRKTHYKEKEGSKAEIEKGRQKYDGKRQKNNKNLREKIRKLEELENIRERKERRNNNVIKRWEVPKRESLEAAVEEMLKNSARGTNMVTVKIKGKDQKKDVMIKKKKLKDKNILIDNDLTWKERQVQKEIRMIAEAEKEKRAKVKIDYRKLQVNEKKFVWKGEKGLKEQNFWSRLSSKNFRLIARLDDKDVQFWECIKEFDIIEMVETRIKEKRWNKLKERMPENFNWKWRAIGGTIIEVKKNIEEKNKKQKKKGLKEYM
ncbi:hypothetical protein P5V15_015541 [Pogonomyrmex californicus]